MLNNCARTRMEKTNTDRNMPILPISCLTFELLNAKVNSPSYGAREGGLHPLGRGVNNGSLLLVVLSAFCFNVPTTKPSDWANHQNSVT